MPRPCQRKLGIEHLQYFFWIRIGHFEIIPLFSFRKTMSLFAASQKKAYIAPFAIFILLLGLGDAVEFLCKGNAHFLLVNPKYWIFPLQTILCAALLVCFWRSYEFKPPSASGIAFSLLVAIVTLLVWIAPQEFFSAAPRLDGFNALVFRGNPAMHYTSLVFRFMRLVVVIPFIEEIFWRGFLLRYFIRDDFENIPVGSFSWLSFGVVTAGFCIEHQQADWPAALVAGALFNLVAIRTRSLSACVLAHAATNLLLGIYIMRTGQWGFW